MKMSRFSRHNFNRVLILFGRPTSLEVELQSEHAKLISSGYYRNFRQVMETFYLELRLDLDRSSQNLFAAGLSASEIKLGAAQKSMVRTLQANNFKQAIVYSKLTNTNLWFPVSRKSRSKLTELKIDFSPFACSILHEIYKFLFVARSIQKVCTNYLFLIHKFIRHEKAQSFSFSSEKLCYLSGLSPSNFPNDKFVSYNFQEWVQNKLGSNTLFFHDCSNLDTLTIPDAFPRVQYNPVVTSVGPLFTEIQIVFKIFILIVKSIFSTKVSVFEILSQIDEISISIRVHSKSFEADIDFALFPNTVIVVRPLWSINLERSGSRVVLVHYSASAEPIEIGSMRVVDGVWNLSSWSSTWVVDTHQEDQMRSISQFAPTEFEVVGVPYWSGRKLEPLSFVDGPWVSVFDTTIRSNLVFSASSIDDLGWNNSHLEEQFIRLVLEAAVPLNLKILHKKSVEFLRPVNSILIKLQKY